MFTWDEYYNFANRLARLYSSFGVDDNVVCKKTGISISAINKWRDLDSMPSADSLIKLAEFFDCSTDYLIGRNKHSEELNHAIDCLSDDNQELVKEYAKLLLLKQKQDEKELREAYEKISPGIANFDEKYRFADNNEKKLIEQCLSHLRFTVNGIRLLKADPIPHNRMYLCFMSKRKAMLNNYLCGEYSDFMNDLEQFSKISEYQLLIDAEAEFSSTRKGIYIRNNGELFDVNF